MVKSSTGEARTMEKKIIFKANYNRIIDSIFYLSEKNKSEGKTDSLGVHRLMKMFFFADVDYLNSNRFVIYGGNYVAMKYGAVHSQALDIINNNTIGLPDSFSAKYIEKDGNKIKVININEYGEVGRFLSDSHKESMNRVWNKYKDYDFGQLTEESHKHKAWYNAWNNRKNNAPEMDYRDFFDEGVDKKIIDDIAEYSKNALV